MEKSDQHLLFKDLSSRLYYGVMISYCDWIDEIEDYGEIVDKLYDINIDNYIRVCDRDEEIYIDCVKPYLFPLSSMTEEQQHLFFCRFIENEIDFIDFKHYYLETGRFNKLFTSISDCGDVIEWFNENHFDYRGLIPKGLALDATGKNIYI